MAGTQIQKAGSTLDIYAARDHRTAGAANGVTQTTGLTLAHP